MSTTPPTGSGGAEAQRELERARRDAADIASDLGDAAKARGREQVDAARYRAAERTESFADAIDSSADDLERHGEPGISGYGHSMAELMRRFAGGLRENDIEDLAGQLALYARRSPAAFLAGSVALGFGVSRFLKATSSRPLDDDYDDDYLLDDDEDDLDMTLEPAASPEVSTYAASDPWPHDGSDVAPASPQQSPPASSTSATEAPGTPIRRETGGIHRE